MTAKILSLALALGAVAPVALAEPVVLTEAPRDRAMAGGVKTLMTTTTMGSVALADAPKATHAGMVQLTEAQLDQVTAGQLIIDETASIGAVCVLVETCEGNAGVPGAPEPDNNGTNVPESFHLEVSEGEAHLEVSEGEAGVSVLVEGYLVGTLNLHLEASEVHGSDAGSVAVDVVVGSGDATGIQDIN